MLSEGELFDLCEVTEMDQMNAFTHDVVGGLRVVMSRNDLEPAHPDDSIRVALKKFLAALLIMEQRCKS